MLLFCPTCGTSLVLEEGEGCNQFICRSCEYILPISKTVKSRIYPKKKEDDKIEGGTATWETAQVARERCPVCSHDKAYFIQLQTRSSDEPMTIFFRCANCAHRWKE